VNKLDTTVDNQRQVELSDRWLFGTDGGRNTALDRSVENGSITPAQRDMIIRADMEGKIDKEVIILKNNQDGRNIPDSFGSHPELGTGSRNPVSVTIIEIPKTLPKPGR
jgi:hypothetical protein